MEYIKSNKAQKRVGIIRERDLFEGEWRDHYLNFIFSFYFRSHNIFQFIGTLHLYCICALLSIYLHLSVPLYMYILFNMFNNKKGKAKAEK